MILNKSLFISLLSMCLIIGVGFITFNHCTTYRTIMEPNGDYTAVVTFKTYLSFLPMSPGSSSDKAGFIEIFDNESNSLGKMPIPMLQLASIHWHENGAGASVKTRGEWDFNERTCFYWDKSQSYKIECKGV